MGSRLETNVHFLSQTCQDFGHMQRAVLGMNWGVLPGHAALDSHLAWNAGRRACSICPIREALVSSHKHTLVARYMERIEAAAPHGILV